MSSYKRISNVLVVAGCGLVLAGAVHKARGQCQANEHVRLSAAEGGNFFDSVAISGDLAVVGGSTFDELGESAGAAFVLRFNGNEWIPEATLTASYPSPFDSFGRSVAVSGEVVLVGRETDYGEGANSGSAYVYRLDAENSEWIEEALLTASDAQVGDFFGVSVSISGDVALIGATWADDAGLNSGAAYVLRYDGTHWIEEAKLTASDAAASDNFGDPVAVSATGDVVVVGATGAGGGAAYVYRNNGIRWIEEAKLVASDGSSPLDAFGDSVTISGDVVMVGSHQDTDSCPPDTPYGECGSVYVYRLDSGEWVEEAKLTAAEPTPIAHFGMSVSLSGDLALIGTPHDQTDEPFLGSTYVFRFDSGQWLEQAKLTASDAVPFGEFGESVAISGDLAVIAAGPPDNGNLQVGAAYVFVGLSDCNGNITLDLCDIADGISQDENANGIPDECDPCEGDANGDGIVNPLDSGFVLGRFGCEVGAGDPDCDSADQNGDGLVDPLDVGFVLARFGDCP